MKRSNKGIIMFITATVLIMIILGTGFLFKESINELNSPKGGNETSDTVKKPVEKPKKPISNSGKVAYITIDDGPSKYTNQILDILDTNGIKATFFMIDGNMKKYPDEVKRVQEEGNSVGFHSVTHEVKELYKTPEATVKEFETCQETFLDLTGEVSNLIRVPYGSKPYMPEKSHEALAKNGYIMWDWNLDTQDWKGTTDNIVSNVLYYGRDNPNLVVLIHEKKQTVEALDSMIKVLKERDYNIVPISEDVKALNFWDKSI